MGLLSFIAKSAIVVVLKLLIAYFCNLLYKLFHSNSDMDLVEKYVKIGIRLGGEISCSKRPGFEKMLNEWADLEKKYVDLGYKSISLDTFAENDNRVDINKFLRIPLNGEEPIYHAILFKEQLIKWREIS